MCLLKIRRRSTATKSLSGQLLNASARSSSRASSYGQLSELYGGAEGQALLDAVTAEHKLIGKLTASGMSYADIEGLVDSSDVDVSGKDSSLTDNGSYNEVNGNEIDGQTSFFE